MNPLAVHRLMTDAGFVAVATEVNGMAYHRVLTTSAYYWITEHRTARLPETLETPVMVGYYWNIPHQYRLYTFDTLRQAVAWIVQHTDGLPHVHGGTVPTHIATVLTPGEGADDPAYL